MKKVNDLQIANVQPQGVACCLIFSEFQSVVAYKSVAYKKKVFNTTVKMETFFANAYTCLDQKSKLFETNSIASGTKELFQRKICIKKFASLKWFRKVHAWLIFVIYDDKILLSLLKL